MKPNKQPVYSIIMLGSERREEKADGRPTNIEK
jgi:hypothetical protein